MLFFVKLKKQFLQPLNFDDNNSFDYQSVHLKGFQAEMEALKRKKNAQIQAVWEDAFAHMDKTNVEYFDAVVNLLDCQTWESWVNNALLPDHS